MFSVGDPAEAKALIVATCSIGLDGRYYAVELANEQTLENLELFSQKLEHVHSKYFRGTPRCRCK